VHGIQLGVKDGLYKKPTIFAKTILKGISNDEKSSESDYEHDNYEIKQFNKRKNNAR
jgi:hypothetical protein